MNVNLNDILLEWAMRSKDGLVNGYKDPEDIVVLKKVLKENGIEETKISDIISNVINSNEK